MNNKLLIFFAEIVFKHFQKTHFQKESPYFHASFTNRKNAKQRFLHLMTEDMGFEPTHAFTRLLRFQHSLLSLLSNLPYKRKTCFLKTLSIIPHCSSSRYTFRYIFSKFLLIPKHVG